MDPSYYGGIDPYTQMRMRQFEQYDGYDANANTRSRAESRGRPAEKKAERQALRAYFTDQVPWKSGGEIDERRELRTYPESPAKLMEQRGRDFTRARDREEMPARRARPEMQSFYTDQGSYGPGYAIGLRSGGYEIQECPYRDQECPYRDKPKRDISNHRLYDRAVREAAERRERVRTPEFDIVPYSSRNRYYGHSPKKSGNSYVNGGDDYGRSWSGGRTPPRGVSRVDRFKSGYGDDSPGRSWSGGRTPPRAVSPVTRYESGYGEDFRGRMPRERSYGSWEYGAM